MLSIDPGRAFSGGLAIFGAASAADVAIHLAGWSAAEPPVHWAIFAGMLVTLAGVFLRALGPSQRGKEPVHAHW